MIINGRRSFAFLVVSIFVLRSIGFAQTGIDGFGSKLSETQRKLEDQFRSVPSATNAREELRRLTS